MFNLFRKKDYKKEKNYIYNLAYDYDGYNMSYEDVIMDKDYIKKFNDIITNSSIDITNINLYDKLTPESDSDIYYEFYDEWMKKLMENNYIVHYGIDGTSDIRNLVSQVNNILNKKNYNQILDASEVYEEYKKEIVKYIDEYGNRLEETFIYGLLELNIIVKELRKINLELLAIFSGFDNNNLCIIKKDEFDFLIKIQK